jgi:hypothetical protein
MIDTTDYPYRLGVMNGSVQTAITMLDNPGAWTPQEVRDYLAKALANENEASAKQTADLNARCREIFGYPLGTE